MINSSMLAQYAGQTVRIVGKVQKMTGNTLLIQTSDLGNVEIALNPDSDISGSTFVEVTGKVSEGGSSLDGNQIREFTTVDCGDGVGKCCRTIRHCEHCFPQQTRLTWLFLWLVAIWCGARHGMH